VIYEMDGWVDGRIGGWNVGGMLGWVILVMREYDRNSVLMNR